MIPVMSRMWMPHSAGTTASCSVDWHHVTDYLKFTSETEATALTNLATKRTWERQGGATIQSSIYKFGGTAAYLDGVNDYLSGNEQPNAMLIDADEEMTAEMFIYPSGTGETVDDVLLSIIASGTSSGISVSFMHSESPTVWRLSIRVGGTWTDFDGPERDWDALYSGQWVHLALVKDSTTARLFINGVEEIEAVTTMPSLKETVITVGADQPAASYFEGYIDDLYIIKKKLYTDTFTPRTSELQSTQCPERVLIHFDSEPFVDVDENTTVTTSGAPVDTSVYKFGGGSLDLTGASHSVTLDHTAILDMYAKDWSIEFWYRPTALPSGEDIHTLFWFGPTTAGNPTIHIYMNGSGELLGRHYMEYPQYDFGACYGNHGMSVDTWYHIVFCRKLNKMAVFVDGARLTNVASPHGGSLIDYTTSAAYDPIIGSAYGGVSRCNGHLDEFRWMIGSTPYDPNSSSITVPTSAFTD